MSRSTETRVVCDNCRRGMSVSDKQIGGLDICEFCLKEFEEVLTFN